MRHHVRVSVAIVGGDPGLARSLADRLEARNTRAVTVAANSAAAIESELRGAAEALGETPAVVRLGFDPGQAASAPLVSTFVDDWQARAEAPLTHAFHFHQAAARFLADGGGRIIVVLPTTGLSGAAGFAPLATAAEGERSLAKAQARMNGAYNISVNCIALTSSVLAGTKHSLDRGGLPPEVFPLPDHDRLAELIVALCGPGFTGVTGQTIALDGGRWMAP
jgi:3-oxoacyl-[acyl-carrier protein] reductase